MLTDAPPPGRRDQPVHRLDLDVDNALLGDALQPGVVVQDAHVALGLRLCYGCHIILAHALELQLHHKFHALMRIGKDQQYIINIYIINISTIYNVLKCIFFGLNTTYGFSCGGL